MGNSANKSMIGRFVRCKCAYKNSNLKKGEIYRIGNVTKDGYVLLQANYSTPMKLEYVSPGGYDLDRFELIKDEKVWDAVRFREHQAA